MEKRKHIQVILRSRLSRTWRMKDERVTGVEDDTRFEMCNVPRDGKHQKNTGLKTGGKQSMGL